MSHWPSLSPGVEWTVLNARWRHSRPHFRSPQCNQLSSFVSRWPEISHELKDIFVHNESICHAWMNSPLLHHYYVEVRKNKFSLRTWFSMYSLVYIIMSFILKVYGTFFLLCKTKRIFVNQTRYTSEIFGILRHFLCSMRNGNNVFYCSLFILFFAVFLSFFWKTRN